MNYAEFVLTGYAVSLGAIGGYAWWVVRRGRRLSDQVPPDRRRFLD